MSFIINGTENECPIRFLKSEKCRLYLGRGEWHDIADVVIYDAAHGEVITRQELREFLTQPSIVIHSMGATTGVAKVDTPNLTKEEMFVHEYEGFTMFAKNPVTLYIPITYFKDYHLSMQSASGHLDKVTTSQKLTLFFEHKGDTQSLTMNETDEFLIKQWYMADRKKWFEERRKLDDIAKKEIIRMQQRNVSHEELKTYLHKYHSELSKRAEKEFSRLRSGGEFFLGFIDDELAPSTSTEQKEEQ